MLWSEQWAPSDCRRGSGSSIDATFVDLGERMKADPQLGRFWKNRGKDGMRREEQLILDFLCGAISVLPLRPTSAAQLSRAAISASVMEPIIMRMGRFGQIVSQARLIWLAGRGGAVEADCRRANFPLRRFPF